MKTMARGRVCKEIARRVVAQCPLCGHRAALPYLRFWRSAIEVAATDVLRARVGNARENGRIVTRTMGQRRCDAREAAARVAYAAEKLEVDPEWALDEMQRLLLAHYPVMGRAA